MLTCLLLCAILAMKVFPETAVARWFERATAATLAAAQRIERKHLIFLVLMTVILVAGTELLAMAGPFDMALVVMWDVSAYLDIVLTTAVVATAARGGAGWRFVLRRFAPLNVGRKRSAARRRRKTSRPAMHASNDDEEHRGWARAA